MKYFEGWRETTRCLVPGCDVIA